MIVIVRLKPTGLVRWFARKRFSRNEARASNLGRQNLAQNLVQTAAANRASAMRSRARTESLIRSLGLAALGLAMCAVPAADGTVITNRPVKLPAFTADPRIERLRAFFNSYNCPAPRHIAEYLRAADTYGLDYRILPALSVRESTCGQHQRNQNNRWGWASGDSSFGSIPSGIEYVARHLAQAPQYKGKTLDQILWTYNPRSAYASEIKRLMLKIER